MPTSVSLSNSIVSHGFKETLTDKILSLEPIAYWSLDDGPAGNDYIITGGNPLTYGDALITCGNDSSLNDIIDNGHDTTWEIWLHSEESSAYTRYIFSKGSGFYIREDSGERIRVTAAAATQNGDYRTSAIIPSGEWFHLLVHWDDTTKRFDVAFNGVWSAPLVDTDLQGAYTSDATEDMLLINVATTNGGWYGKVGWARISNTARQTPGVDFTPPSRTTIPTSDANTLLLLPMNEGYGTVAGDLSSNNNDGTITDGDWSAYPAATESINGYNGTYTGVVLANSINPYTTPYFDGVNDEVDIYNATLASAWNAGENTIIAWIYKTDWIASGNYVYMSPDGTNNQIYIRNYTSDGQVNWNYTAGGTGVGVTKSGVGNNSWYMVAMTISVSADEMKAYFNGEQEGSTQTGLGVWAGIWNSSRAKIGARLSTAVNPFLGYIAHVALFNKVLTPSEIEELYQKSGMG